MNLSLGEARRIAASSTIPGFESRLTFQWKHGWIPLTHAAAVQKYGSADAAAAKGFLPGQPPKVSTPKDAPSAAGGSALDDPGTYPGDTPVPKDVGHILNKWVQLSGSELLNKQERTRLLSAVIRYGQKTPTLSRGVNMQASAKDFPPGKPLDFGPTSTSEDEGASLPYAENGDQQPVLFIFDGGAPYGLNVQNRAEATSGYAEAEWIVGGRFYVQGQPEMDSDGVLVVSLKDSPRLDPVSRKNSRKPGRDMSPVR